MRRKEQQLDKELGFHIEQHAADLIARGVDPIEARRQALLILGGSEQVKESCRDVRPTRWLEEMGRDFRYTLRMLRHNPAFTAVALITLALGVGATTVMFTLVNSVLLKPLPYANPGRLIAVHGYSSNWNAALYGEQNLAYYDFLDCQSQSRLTDLAGWIYNAGTLRGSGDPEHAVEFRISSNFFSVLGVPLQLGRAFLPEEDQAAGTPVAILGYDLWKRRFGGSEGIIGARIDVGGKGFTVIGVAARNFRVHDEEADVYTPAGQDTAPFLKNRRAHPVGVIARLRPGATLAQARAEMGAIGNRLARQYPATNKDRGFTATILKPEVGDVGSVLWLLLGAVTLVLAIACVNIASLLLARAVSRERELAMHVALGASRSRLVRQFLTESAVLALCGGALGAVLAIVGVKPFVAMWPGTLPRASEIHFDWRVLLFALAASLLSGILFGVAPAFRAPVDRLERTLREGGRGSVGGSHNLHSAFVISEVALAVVLLVCAGMLGRSILRLSVLSPGLRIDNLLIARVSLSPSLSDPAKIRAAWRDVLEQGGRIPGVESIAAVDTVPMRQGNNQIGYSITPAALPENLQPVTLATSVTPSYVKTMGIALQRGRFFTEGDSMDSGRVAVIDEVLARQAFGVADPIGKPIWFDLGKDPWKIVGVVSHVRHWGFAGDDGAQVRAQLYYPFAQVPDRYVARWSELMSIAVRTHVAPRGLVEPLRRAVRGATGDQVLYDVRTMDQLARATLARQRFLLTLFSVFAGVALLLACVGIYGVLAYLTNQRVPEIGIRMALGASRRDVIRMILLESMTMTLAGVVSGIAAAAAAGAVLIHHVEGMRSMEPTTFIFMAAVLFAAAFLASFLPARRASRIEPMQALR